MSIWAPAGSGSHATAITSIHARTCHLFITISLSCSFGLARSIERPLTPAPRNRHPPPASAHRLDPGPGRSRGDELRPQPGHVHVDRAGLDESILAPDQVEQL